MALTAVTYGAAPATYPDMLTAVNSTNAMASTTTTYILNGKDQVHTVAGGLVRPASVDVSALYRRRIEQVGGARASLQRGQPGARHNLRLLPLADSWLEVRDIEVFGVVDMFGNTGSGANQIWERCLIHGNRDTWTGNVAFCCASDRGTGNNNVYRNLALYDSFVGWWSGANSGNLIDVYNVACLQCGYGVANSRTYTGEMKNFLVGASVLSDYFLAGGAWPTRANNQSADGTGDVGHQNKPIALEVASSTRFSEDASLIAGAFALQSAEDLTAKFTDDYFQATRGAGIWDKGPDQRSTVVPPAPDVRLEISAPARTRDAVEAPGVTRHIYVAQAVTRYTIPTTGLEPES